MNCRKCRHELERFLDNELAQSERAIVEQHLAACAECRARLKELQALGSMLQAQPRAEPGQEYLSGFNDRFWHELKRRRRMKAVEPERRFRSVFLTRIGTVAAAALLLIAVGLVGYRSWHSFFEHPTAALPQPAPEAIPAPAAAGGTVEPKAVSRAAEPGASAAEPQAEEAKLAVPKPAGVKPALKSSPAPAATPPPQLPRAQAQGQAEGGKGRGLAEQILDALRAGVSAGSVETQTPQSGARKGGLKTAEQKGGVTSGPTSGPGVGGVSAQALDTVIYAEDALSVKPVLVSIPDASDDARMKYPNLEVPVWVVVEKDGSVSRVESRSATADAGLTGVALALARQAQFTPGKRVGNAVRVGKTIVVRIRALNQKND